MTQSSMTDTHSLESKWTYYYLVASPSGENYIDRIVPVSSFSTAEDFWAVYSHLKYPTELEDHAEYHLFRDNYRAVWEDENVKNGGKWFFCFPKEIPINQVWEKTLLALIGEQIDEDVVGATLSVRENINILSFWTKSSDKDKVEEVRKSILKAANLPKSRAPRFKKWQ